MQPSLEDGAYVNYLGEGEGEGEQHVLGSERTPKQPRHEIADDFRFPVIENCDSSLTYAAVIVSW